MLKRTNRVPGRSALLIAGASGQELTAIFLLDHGADPNVADENGFTPLHFTRVSGLALVNRVRKNQEQSSGGRLQAIWLLAGSAWIVTA
ncbi:MAG: ankyrin repeat domain-containing protein [Candidatus Acidiferrales bacterium]